MPFNDPREFIDVAGGLRGAPIELVKCETSDPLMSLVRRKPPVRSGPGQNRG